MPKFEKKYPRFFIRRMGCRWWDLYLLQHPAELPDEDSLVGSYAGRMGRTTAFRVANRRVRDERIRQRSKLRREGKL